MLRILVFAGVLAVAFASVPALLEDRLTPPRAEAPTAPAAPRAEPAVLSSGGRKVRLAADEAGHFRAEFRLNGRAVPALVDTGATLIAINRATARRIGLSVAESDFTAFANTANGRVRVAPVVIDRVALGRIELDRVAAVVLDDEALSGALVGMSFLSRLKRYSVEGGALALEQ
ncbi:MAG TPA: TIGR02281 family clan AA aspartic protease [Aquamicrobium sp.]|nr:TIGR02281 family clan AA aspartic protease [Aquamicrobium sp.]